MRLDLLPITLGVVRMDPEDSMPKWAFKGSFCSVTRTEDELSIFCDSNLIPEGIKKVDGWRAFKVAGQLDFQLSGIIAQLAMPLSAKQISIFSISTHDTDYILVQNSHLEDAMDVLRRVGHKIRIPE